jgi:uncharacterized protein involved in exopolysaccharide biosynthesis
MINEESGNFDDEIDLKELFHAVFNGRWIIASITSIISVIVVVYSLILPDIYESKAILTPVNSTNGISGAIQSYSGLAGLAGINLPYGDDDSNHLKALKKINSLSFFKNNILTNINLPDLMAVKNWDHDTNSIIYDSNIFEINSNTWVRKYSYPQQEIPSAQESFKVFAKKHLSLNEDSQTGHITLSIRHQSPFIAQQWSELIVSEINNFYKEKDKSESEKAASFLNQQISMSDLSEINQVLSQLLQEELKKLTLIEANQYYVFEYIDPPAVMEEKSEPDRASIIILGTIFGFILSVSIILIRHYSILKQT